jgi:hypothetical protein
MIDAWLPAPELTKKQDLPCLGCRCPARSHQYQQHSRVVKGAKRLGYLIGRCDACRHCSGFILKTEVKAKTLRVGSRWL